MLPCCMNATLPSSARTKLSAAVVAAASEMEKAAAALDRRTPEAGWHPASEIGKRMPVIADRLHVVADEQISLRTR